MLLGAAIVIALVRDRGDDRRLIVIPAVRGDAGLLADLRARAVGADQQPRGNRLAVGELNVDRIRRVFETADRAGAQLDAELFRLRDQRIDQMPVLDHVRERLARLHLAAEGEERRPHRVVELASRSPPCRGSAARCRRPRPRRRSPRTAAARRPRSPRRAGPSIARRQRRVDHRHREGLAQPLAQRDRQRQAGKARPRRSPGRSCGAAQPSAFDSLRLPCKVAASIAG